MSHSSIKLGRYSRERKQLNKSSLMMINDRRKIAPYLLSHSDSDDLIIMSTKLFHDAIHTEWIYDIPDFEKKFSEVTQSTLFPSNFYKDVLNVCGVEVDSRKSLLELLDSIIEVEMLRFFKVIRKLPGLNNMDKKQFFKILFNSKVDLQIFAFCNGNLKYSENGLSIRLSENRFLNIEKSDLLNIIDDSVGDMSVVFNSSTDLSLQTEESIFLLILGMLKPRKKNPQQINLYERFLTAFSRYLESIYGSSYHRRLLDIVNVTAKYFSMFYSNLSISIKWRKENKYFFDKMYNHDCLTKFWMTHVEEEGVEILNKLY